MNRIFLGKPSHWALWVVIALVMVVAGHVHMHVIWFNEFILLLLGLTLVVVLYIIVTYHPGDRITREPFDDGMTHEPFDEE